MMLKSVNAVTMVSKPALAMILMGIVLVNWVPAHSGSETGTLGSHLWYWKTLATGRYCTSGTSERGESELSGLTL